MAYVPRGGWVKLDGQCYPIRAGVSTISGYSAHADQRDLLNFVKRMRHWPGEARLAHGDPGARATLREQLLDLAQKRGTSNEGFIALINAGVGRVIDFLVK